MKKTILSIAFTFALSLSSFAQTALADNPINFEQIKTVKEKSEVKILTKEGITEYTSSNGSVIKIGDKFKINRPEGGSKTFVSISNKPTVMDAFASTAFNSTVNTSMSNTEITIKTLYIAGSRKLGFKTYAELATCGTCNNLLVDIELAIETKEIRTNGISSDDALIELKKSKDKLDLGLISQAEYDTKKSELVKYIK
ncbi:hypothetical protein ACNQGL_07765 [Flavobacterium sp. LB3P21]|uniref:hypothetical protein n=1 Tax=Flavobacterium sp. LB3P21 TaxID=3401719 RepID=UPI003AB06D97